MGVTEQALGLRDRKKIRTRDNIRREAMRLFDANGYTNTTIEQIAEASDIASSTFFRYFPRKESVLVADDLDRAMVEALARQPAQMTSVRAFRNALEAAFATVSHEERKLLRRRHQMVISIPEVKAAQYDSYLRTVSKLVEADCRRTGPGADDFAVRVLFGALGGALMAVLDIPADAISRMYRALNYIEAGMQLS